MLFSKYVDPLTDGSRKLMSLKPKRCGAVIVAAGTASRMGGLDKIMEQLDGEPMIAKTVRAFQSCAAIAEIVIVTREDLILPVKNACAGMDKVTAVVVGGKDRAESVNLGLNALSGKVKLAAIHDGARPLVTERLIDRVVRAANCYGAAAPGVPVKDTIKITSRGLVSSTPDRKTLQAVQTPQVFSADLYRAALATVSEDYTDDNQLMEKIKHPVKLVDLGKDNIKITHPDDVPRAEFILKRRENAK